MTWIVPKNDWKSSDYFLLSDWQRIISNAKYLYNLVNAQFYFRDCTLANTAALPYYDIINNLERNLEDLWDALVTGTYIRRPTWYARTSSQWTRNPDYSDFNSWESVELSIFIIYNTVTNPKNVLRSGTFFAGSNRIVQTFSRGR